MTFSVEDEERAHTNIRFSHDRFTQWLLSSGTNRETIANYLSSQGGTDGVTFSVDDEERAQTNMGFFP